MREIMIALCALLVINTAAQDQMMLDREIMPDLSAYENYLNQAVDFSLSFLRFSSRPYMLRFGKLRFNDVLLNDPQSGLVPYGALGSMLSVARDQRGEQGLFFGIDQVGISGRLIDLQPFHDNGSGRAVAAFSNRTYPYRLQGAYNYRSTNNWALMIDVSRRWGRSLTTRGVWADAMGFMVAAQKQINSNHSVQITAMLAPNERATTSPTTQEAFDLSRNNLYNPSWGMWGDKERGTRVRSTVEPMAFINHQWQVSDEYKVKNALFVRVGSSTQSALNWGGAPNPLPDYWAAMPSAQPTAQLAQMVSDAWRGDVNVRQIDFAQMVAVNSTSDVARYVIENRVRDVAQFTMQSSIFGKSFSAGVALTYFASQNYKIMDDLLGAKYWRDVDSFLEQDEDLKDFTSNNNQDPDRRITQGDRFGYNYTMLTFSADVWGAYKYIVGKWSFTAGASLAPKIDQRQGHYEKQNFDSRQSLGASNAVATMDGDLKLLSSYKSDNRIVLDFALNYRRVNPVGEKLFISPLYRNALAPHTTPLGMFGAEACVKYVVPKFRTQASVYYMACTNGSSLYNVYDDLRHLYVHYSLSGINSSYLGVEASTEVALVGSKLSLKAAVSLQNNVYTNNPLAKEYKESTGEDLMVDQRVLYSGLHIGGSPEMAGVVALDYRPSYGWGFVLTGNVFGAAYAIPSPIRRTYDALSNAASSEAMLDMQNQQRLPSGFTLDLFAGKTWYFATTNRSVGLYCGVNNVLNKRDIATVGYESGRLRNLGSSYSKALVAHPSKYYFAQGVNFFINVSYNF